MAQEINKMNWKTILLSTLAVFAPIKAALATVLVLIVADLALGIWAAKKRGELITSAGLRRTVVKLVVYEVAVLLSFLAQQYLTGELVPVMQLTTAYIGLVEVKSVVENLNEISGTSLLKSLLDKLNSLNLK